MKILALVTRQKSCQRLIDRSLQLAQSRHGKLSVVHVVQNGENFLGNPEEGAALEYLFDISKQAGADMTVLRSDDVIATITHFVREQAIDVVVLGASPRDRDAFKGKLERKLPGVEFFVVTADER